VVVAGLPSIASGQSSTPAPIGSAARIAQYRLVTPGTLTVGYNEQAQFSTVDNGQPDGVFGRLWIEAAKRLGLKLDTAQYDFAALVPALQAGRFDVFGAGFSVTQPRAQIFYFVPPDLLTPEIFTIRKGEHIDSWEEAKARNLTVGVEQGFFEISLWEKLGVPYKAFDSSEACMQDAINGGVIGCAGVSVRLLYALSQDPTGPYSNLENIPIHGPLITADTNSWALNKNNDALAWDLNQVMADMWRDGTVLNTWNDVWGQGNHDLFVTMPTGLAIYQPGPWEPGTWPAAPPDYPDVKTITPGTLTVGVAPGASTLTMSGDQIAGPEAAILKYVAQKLNLQIKPVSITDAAAAVRSGQVDIAAGQVPATADTAKQFWQTTPIGFSPDYIYAKAQSDGSAPTYTSWEDITQAGGSIAVVTGSPRIKDLQADGATVMQVASADEGLKAVAAGTALGFVGSTVDYVTAVSSDPDLATADIRWVRNNNSYTNGTTYAWAVPAGNTALINGLNQAIDDAWMHEVIANAYADAYKGANTTAMIAPGPTAIGTSSQTSKDYNFVGMWLPGPWAQAPGYVQ
jgi:polar amino acid transport system substrate-binding protein